MTVVGLAPTAVGYIWATARVAAAAGPLVGGFVTDLLGWCLFLAEVLFGELVPLG